MKYKKAIKNIAPMYWNNREVFDDAYDARYCEGARFGIIYSLARVYNKDFKKIEKDLDKAVKKWWEKA